MIFLSWEAHADARAGRRRRGPEASRRPERSSRGNGQAILGHHGVLTVDLFGVF